MNITAQEIQAKFDELEKTLTAENKLLLLEYINAALSETNKATQLFLDTVNS